MTGICKQCGSPLLERYNGKLFCCKCGEPGQSLEVTAENDREFRLSELCFFRYLLPKTSDTIRKARRQALLTDAIRLCASAAAAGHPKAIFRSGYYAEYYAEQTVSKADRIRRAVDCYLQIYHGRYEEIKQESNTVIGPEAFEQLRQLSASHCLRLLQDHPDLFESKTLQQAVREMAARYGGTLPSGQTQAAVSRAEEIYQTLEACYAKERQPLFGVFFMKGSDLHALGALQIDKSRGRSHNVQIMCEHLFLHYMRCREDHQPITEFMRIRKGAFPTERDVRNEDGVCICFFNAAARGNLKASRIKKIRQALFDENKIRNLASDMSGREVVLYTDDVMWADVKHKGDLDEWIDEICAEV